ncbi:plasmid mobilization protein [Faecalibacterium hattorii]|uniref:plasmid mobilization protein n=1 Tax=Faecalibacterium hattorii TaxID=2935520 RepID=UPI003AABB86E
MPHKTYNTPKRKCVVKTRLTEDERRAFEDKCAALSMTQSEYIRQAVFYSRISPVIWVTAHSEEMLTAVSSLVAQYGKIGSNLLPIGSHNSPGLNHVIAL